MSVPKVTKCSDCAYVVDSVPNYCPKCGCDVFEKEAKFDMEDVDFPVIVEYESYEDTYGMWDRFCEQSFGTRVKGNQVANMPDSLPRMKYTVFSTYWKVTKHSIKGPFLTKQEARDA